MVNTRWSPLQWPSSVPGRRTTPPPVSSHAVAAAHTEELEGLTTRIHSSVPGLWGGTKKEKAEDWQWMLAQGKSFTAKINK